MNTIEIAVFSDAINYMVIQAPGRQFPAMVLQGDTLRGLCRLAENVQRLAQTEESANLRDEAEDLCEKLRDRVAFYEAVLDSFKISIPYPDRVTNPPDSI